MFTLQLQLDGEARSPSLDLQSLNSVFNLLFLLLRVDDEDDRTFLHPIQPNVGIVNDEAIHKREGVWVEVVVEKTGDVKAKDPTAIWVWRRKMADPFRAEIQHYPSSELRLLQSIRLPETNATTHPVPDAAVVRSTAEVVRNAEGVDGGMKGLVEVEVVYIVLEYEVDRA